MIALHLQTGKPVWQTSLSTRLGGVPVVAGERVLVGTSTLEALDAHTGQPVWSREGLSGTPVAARRKRAEEVLDAVGLGTRFRHRPDQLSGGERQRVAIGRAIVMKPSLLLADEPTGNLDSRSSAEVVEIIEQLNADGISLMVVTHDPDLGERARRHLFMRDGKIISDDGEST